MLAAFALAVLATSPASPEPLKLAAPGLTTADLEPAKAQFLNDYFAEQINRRSNGRISIVTESQVRELLGVERQRQLLGCSDDATDCMVEIAGALDVQGLVQGNVARFGDRYAVMVRVVGFPDGQTLWSGSEKNLAEAQLVDWMAQSAGAVVSKLGAGSASSASSATASRPAANANRPPTPPARRTGAARADPQDPALKHNSLYLNLVSVEYARRLRGGNSWLGARVGGQPAVGAIGLGGVGSAMVTARYTPLRPDTKWTYSLVAGAGLGLAAGTNGGIGGFVWTVGADAGHKYVRVTAELMSVANRFHLVPGISAVIPF